MFAVAPSVRVRVAALCAVCVVALTGCAKQLDVDKAEKVIGQNLTKQSGEQVTVTCPDKDVDLKKGAKLRCDAKSKGGQKAVVEITQTDDKGNVTAEIVQ